MGDAVLLLWVGFFLGFWTCAVVVVWYRHLSRVRGWVKRLGEFWCGR